jgi:NAD(P)-dependent dehydrogenase (short-subunit alcohol dehydrogenase family)
LAAYTASKCGVVGLSRSVAGEVLADGIRINVVLPGTARTEMLEAYLRQEPGMEEVMLEGLPMRRFGEPKEVGEAILWLCSPRSSYIHGTSILAAGGEHMFSHKRRPQPKA